MSYRLRIAIMGAPGTGKSTLAATLQSSCVPTEVRTAPTNEEEAVAYRQRFDLTLLMGLDLGANASDAGQNALIDKALRESLQQHALPFALVYGLGAARNENASLAIRFHARDTQGLPQPGTRWRWTCEKCSDPDCEHQLFRDLLQNR